jgi:23S rRNA U2552 (ribose-2'-O)-methylase RlmE/FtsJ
MTEKTIQVIADVDVNRLLDLIDEDIEAMATLATDAEITRQFETIQGELEGILKQYLKELFDKYYLEKPTASTTSGERR